MTYSEQLSNGGGSEYAAEIVDRKVKWLQKNAAIVAQKRQNLASQGIVFEKDERQD